MKSSVLLFDGWLAIYGVDIDELSRIEEYAASHGCGCYILSYDGHVYNVGVEGERLYQFMIDALIAIDAYVK